MHNENINDVTKDGLIYLKKVLEYRSRTIAILFVENSDNLLKIWEHAQFEFGSKYQYHAENDRIWDYYLVICCNFDENSLSEEVRFDIENDRFCCRKVFIFNLNEKKLNNDKLIEALFPKIQAPDKISLLGPEELVSSLNAGMPITQDFFVRSWKDTEIKKLADQLILKAGLHDQDL